MSRKKLFKFLIIYPAAVLTAAFLAGCHPKPPPGGMHRQWTCTYWNKKIHHKFSATRFQRKAAKRYARNVCRSKARGAAKMCRFKGCVLR